MSAKTWLICFSLVVCLFFCRVEHNELNCVELFFYLSVGLNSCKLHNHPIYWIDICRWFFPILAEFVATLLSLSSNLSFTQFFYPIHVSKSFSRRRMRLLYICKPKRHWVCLGIRMTLPESIETHSLNILWWIEDILKIAVEKHFRLRNFGYFSTSSCDLYDKNIEISINSMHDFAPEWKEIEIIRVSKVSSFQIEEVAMQSNRSEYSHRFLFIQRNPKNAC